MSRSIDDILNEMESCIDQWEDAASLQASLDANYKSWEAAQKLALMDTGEEAFRRSSDAKHLCRESQPADQALAESI
jgi:hypothetical protein